MTNKRIAISLRLDAENEEWLRINAALDRSTLADLINQIISEKRLNNPIEISRRAA